MSDSPYEPANLESDFDSKVTASPALASLLWGLTAINALAAAFVLFQKPDVESFLMDYLPGPHMPDAFRGLNQSIPMTMMLVATSSALASWNAMDRRYKMLVPLLAGPAMCFIGSWMTENWDDPNWLNLVATTSLGMLVSCVITAVLMIGQNSR